MAKIFFSGWLLIASTFACAGSIEQLQSFSQHVKTAQGLFTQRVLKDGATKVQASSGKFIFHRPGKFIWIYLKPFEQTLQSDGESLFIYDKDLNQVLKKSLATAITGSPASVLFGSDDMEKNFVLTDVGTRDGIEWVQALPKKNEGTFEKVLIGFKLGTLNRMELYDAFGQTTRLDFSALEFNKSMSSDLFKFSAPSGVDILTN